VLVFTLLILAVILSTTLSAAGIVVLGKNSSRATEKSALAFQIADGAAENVLKRIYKDTDDTLNDLANGLYHDPEQGGNGPRCSSGTVTGVLPSASSGTYAVTFLDSSDDPLECSGTGYATYSEWRTKLAKIVSSGVYGGATRAIDIAIVAPTCTDATVDDDDGNTYDTVAIGNQCWMKQNMRVGTRINSSTAQTNNSPVEIIEKYCYSDNNGNCTAPHPNEPDGGLYLWDEAMQYVATEGTQGICPTGWHIPTDNDWYTLENFLDPAINDPNAGGFRGTTAGTQMKPGGTSGLEMNLTGYRNSGNFGSRDVDGYWWSSTLDSNGNNWHRAVRDSEVGAYRGTMSVGPFIQAFIRCVKD
jgi:uncharacterized protein (TIGR02145 family)